MSTIRECSSARPLRTTRLKNLGVQFGDRATPERGPVGVQVAPHRGPVSGEIGRRVLACAHVHNVGAAGPEPTPAGRVQRARLLTAQDDAGALALAYRIRDR